MMETCKENKLWSGKKMEDGEGLKTLECLRGRLLAERQASRSAKEEEDLMGKKLMELEDKITKETELRNKAEKRLKLLLKKLESLKISSTSVTSENSNSSEISTNSFTTKEIKLQESKSEKNLISKIAEDQEQKKPNQNNPDRTNSSPNSKSPNNSYIDLHRSSQISQIKDQSFSAEVKEIERENYRVNLAGSIAGAAPAAAESEGGAMKMKGIHENVTLKHIRGNVQSSFERRNHMNAILSM